MAENILTLHSILRQEQRLANASSLYFNFDEPDFTNNLNGMTRFITYLGIGSDQVRAERVRFFHDPRLWHTGTVGDTFKYDLNIHQKTKQVRTHIYMYS
jgi:hypothetical protein